MWQRQTRHRKKLLSQRVKCVASFFHRGRKGGAEGRGKFNSAPRRIRNARINIISNETNEPKWITISRHILKKASLALYMSTCLRSHLNYYDLMPALSAAAKHDSRVASTWIAFSHARSTGAKLLLHYGVIKTGRSDKRRLRNMLRHSGGEIGASQSTVLINIRHDVSSQNIYNLNKTLRSDTYIFFFSPSNDTNGESAFYLFAI